MTRFTTPTATGPKYAVSYNPLTRQADVTRDGDLLASFDSFTPAFRFKQETEQDEIRAAVPSTGVTGYVRRQRVREEM